MINMKHDLTAQAVVEFSRTMFKTLSDRFGGEITLNELRVITQVVRCHLAGRTCGVTALHRVTGIPIPTVSRSVAHLQSEGWLSEQPDPSDGRKRIIFIGPRSMKLAHDDINVGIRWINDFREHSLPQ
jgi:DNA-binding MarR family transcriptional regulator